MYDLGMHLGFVAGEPAVDEAGHPVLQLRFGDDLVTKLLAANMVEQANSWDYWSQVFYKQALDRGWSVDFCSKWTPREGQMVQHGDGRAVRRGTKGHV